MGDLTTLRLRTRAAVRWARQKACCLGGGLLLALSGCSSGTACTNNLRPALLVSVVDSAEAQVCNVVVTAEGPETGGPQRLTPSDCRFSGGTSAGHYVLVVSRESQPLVTTEVTVDSDECGVVTKEVKVTVPDP